MKTYYALKWVDSKGRGTGGSRPYQYDLPKRGKPGRWHRKHKEAIRLCENGFHCTNLYSYCDHVQYGPRLFIVEIAGKFSCERGKVAVEAVRFIREVIIDKENRKHINNTNAIYEDYARTVDSIIGKIIYYTVISDNVRLSNDGVIMVEYAEGSGRIGRDDLGRGIPISLPSC